MKTWLQSYFMSNIPNEKILNNMIFPFLCLVCFPSHNALKFSFCNLMLWNCRTVGLNVSSLFPSLLFSPLCTLIFNLTSSLTLENFDSSSSNIFSSPFIFFHLPGDPIIWFGCFSSYKSLKCHFIYFYRFILCWAFVGEFLNSWFFTWIYSGGPETGSLGLGCQ